MFSFVGLFNALFYVHILHLGSNPQYYTAFVWCFVFEFVAAPKPETVKEVLAEKGIDS